MSRPGQEEALNLGLKDELGFAGQVWARANAGRQRAGELRGSSSVRLEPDG